MTNYFFSGINFKYAHTHKKKNNNNPPHDINQLCVNESENIFRGSFQTKKPMKLKTPLHSLTYLVAFINCTFFHSGSD